MLPERSSRWHAGGLGGGVQGGRARALAWRPGSGGRTRRSGELADPRPGGGAVRAAEVHVDDRLRAVAAHVIGGADGGLGA